MNKGNLAIGRIASESPGGEPSVTTGRSEWAGEDSNLRRLSRRVYSPLPLAARAPTLWILVRGFLLWNLRFCNLYVCTLRMRVRYQTQAGGAPTECVSSGSVGEPGIRIRLARSADAEAIRRIYNHEVERTTHTFDLVSRSSVDQVAWLRNRDGALGVLVAEVGAAVVGFASLSEYRSRPAYRTTVESSVYVDESARGTGVGRRLLDELVDLATARGFHTMIARIVGGNDASVGLHRGAGFTTVGVEREVGRKFGVWLDVRVMQRMIG